MRPERSERMAPPNPSGSVELALIIKGKISFILFYFLFFEYLLRLLRAVKIFYFEQFKHIRLISENILNFFLCRINN